MASQCSSSRSCAFSSRVRAICSHSGDAATPLGYGSGFMLNIFLAAAVGPGPTPSTKCCVSNSSLISGAKGDGMQYYDGTVTQVLCYDDGTARHEVEYDDWTGKDAKVWHDLAREQANGKHAWHAVPGVKAPTKATVGDEAQQGGSKQGGSKQSARMGPRTRQQAKAIALIERIDEAVARAEDPAECHDQCMHLFFGAQEGAKYETDKFAGGLGEAASLRAQTVGGHSLPGRVAMAYRPYRVRASVTINDHT